MQTTEYIWFDGKMVPWDQAQVHVLTHALHYGDSVFEGIRESMVCTREVAPITDDVKTYNAWGNEAKAYQCDHIWITNTIKCSEYKTVTQWYDGHKYVSDHFPVYSIIEF